MSDATARERGPDHPCRDVETARSAERRGWYGHGQLTRTEKSRFGRFLDDVVYTFAEISIACLALLYYVGSTAPTRFFGVKSGALVTWLTMVVVAAAIRGGMVTPIGTAVPGWVSMTWSLVPVRIGYYNAVVLLGAYGGTIVATAVHGPLGGVVGPAAVGGLAAGVFPRLAEAYCRIRGS